MLSTCEGYFMDKFKQGEKIKWRCNRQDSQVLEGTVVGMVSESDGFTIYKVSCIIDDWKETRWVTEDLIQLN